MKCVLTILIAVLFTVLMTGTALAGQVSQMAWDAPTVRTDGTPVDPVEIDHYRLHCGMTPGTYVSVTDIGYTTTTPIVACTNGMNYYTVTAVDIWGFESGYSNELKIMEKDGFFISEATAPIDMTKTLRALP